MFDEIDWCEPMAGMVTVISWNDDSCFIHTCVFAHEKTKRKRDGLVAAAPLSQPSRVSTRTAVVGFL